MLQLKTPVCGYINNTTLHVQHQSQGLSYLRTETKVKAKDSSSGLEPTSLIIMEVN